MRQTYKVLSALLSYPTADLQKACPELKEILADEALVSSNDLKRVNTLIDKIGSEDIYDLQEEYVHLFDRTRSLSLHLFEHVHGESRERGQAMVDLRHLYEMSGMEIGSKELPDYIPLFLEFLSTQDDVTAKDLLSEPITVLTAIHKRLKKRQSPYAVVFGALTGIADTKPEEEHLKELMETPDDDPDNLEELDKVWAETEVTFGPGDANCPKAADMLSRMSEPVNNTTRH